MFIFEIIKPENVKINVQYHDELNPLFWASDTKLKPVVRKHILKTAKLFEEFIKIPKVKVLDYVLTGSNANFNWTKLSDLDIHLMVDISSLKKSVPELIEEYLFSKKKIWNDLHDVMIYDHEIECYAQDKDEKHISTGVYSILNNRWIVEPAHEKPDVNDTAIKYKVMYLMNKINNVKNKNKSSITEITALKKKIKDMRMSGLEKAGEFSTENLAFKVLRDHKYLDLLEKSYTNAVDQSLSLKSKS